MFDATFDATMTRGQFSSENLAGAYRYRESFKPLSECTVLEFAGKDAEAFLHGQLTSDVKSLSPHEGHATSRLNRTGKLQGWGFLLKRESDQFFLVVEKSVSAGVKDDLSQFIIMEEVEVKESGHMPILLIKSHKNWGEVKENPLFFTGDFFKEDAGILLQEGTKDNPGQGDLLSDEEFQTLSLISAFPSLSARDELVTNTILNDVAVSYDKGCFLGQETAAKITNNRGAAYYPIFLKIDEANFDNLENKVLYAGGKKAGISRQGFVWKNESYLLTSMARVYRVKGRTTDFQTEEGETFSGKVYYAPFFTDASYTEKAHELYEEGLTLFRQATNEEEEKRAQELLQKSIDIDPQHADAYEALGVIYGRHGSYEKAIELMDGLLQVDADSVMAHTNKSLYLMKLGKIDEAEEEKGLATVASFKQHGDEAKAKKEEEEHKKQQEQELIEREKMFYEVLEIDPEDQIANFGLGDIAFKREQYDSAVAYLEKVLEIDSKHSQAYLLLGKCYQTLGKKEEAKNIFEKGIDIASRQGEMMPANEMQALLVDLSG